jgi:hypothetical protein
MGTEFWAEIYTKKSIERAAHILDLIDEKWPAGELVRLRDLSGVEALQLEGVSAFKVAIRRTLANAESS